MAGGEASDHQRPGDSGEDADDALRHGEALAVDQALGEFVAKGDAR